MDHRALATLVAAQDGVVSRRQVLEVGGDDTFIETCLRRRRWARLHAGVFVDHTGPPSWSQRAWAATLYHWPASLAGRSALVAHGVRVPTPGEPIELVVDRSRRVRDPSGMRTSQLTGYDELTLRHLSPPRVRLEHAVLTVASRAAGDDSAVAVVADACQRRRTTPARLQAALRSMPRLPRRRLLAEILDDVESGAFSVLERRYLRDVERAHGLPRGDRQRREVAGAEGRAVFRDVAYARFTTLVELDGRLGHDMVTDRWRDLDRDLDAAQTGRTTLRAGWRQVLTPCRLAVVVADVLRARGWAGVPRRCGQGCSVHTSGGDRRDPPAPGADTSRPSAA